MPDEPASLEGQLRRAQRLGFLGPEPVENHITHAAGFLSALADVRGRVIDLGSGGGLPGLVVGLARPDLDLVLVDGMAKRCRFLEGAVQRLGLEQVRVLEGRAEVLGRGDLRASAAAVVARSFGTPATTAECAAPLLAVGGRLIVSEPPTSSERWVVPELGLLGLAPGPRSGGVPAIQVLVQVSLCPDAYPRRDGVPAKRPLF